MKHRLRKNWVALALLVLGIISLGIGLASGEYGSVLEKAITVCLDCIGIG